MANVRVGVLTVMVPFGKTTSTYITNNTYMLTVSNFRGCLNAKPLRSAGSKTVPERKLEADPSED